MTEQEHRERLIEGAKRDYARGLIELDVMEQRVECALTAPMRLSHEPLDIGNGVTFTAIGGRWVFA